MPAQRQIGGAKGGGGGGGGGGRGGGRSTPSKPNKPSVIRAAVNAGRSASAQKNLNKINKLQREILKLQRAEDKAAAARFAKGGNPFPQSSARELKLRKEQYAQMRKMERKGRKAAPKAHAIGERTTKYVMKKGK